MYTILLLRSKFAEITAGVAEIIKIGRYFCNYLVFKSKNRKDFKIEKAKAGLKTPGFFILLSLAEKICKIINLSIQENGNHVLIQNGLTRLQKKKVKKQESQESPVSRPETRRPGGPERTDPNLFSAGPGRTRTPSSWCTTATSRGPQRPPLPVLRLPKVTTAFYPVYEYRFAQV